MKIRPDMPAEEIRLHCGELTPDEILLVRAVIRWAQSADHVTRFFQLPSAYLMVHPRPWADGDWKASIYHDAGRGEYWKAAYGKTPAEAIGKLLEEVEK